MTDKTIPADKVREIIHVNTFRGVVMPHCRASIIDQLEALLPPPPRPTLADMTPVARRECQWMQCEVRGDRRIIALILDDRDHNHAVTLDPYGHTAHCSFDSVTPRTDLPRMEWPGDKKPDPAPALPDGWRLADHPHYGRVIVTTPEPDGDGDLWFIAPSAAPGGTEHWCDPAELTYIDQEDDQ